MPASDASAEPIAPGSDDALHILRHSTAHVLAQAVCRLHPGAKYAIGPPVQDGFYYDFDLPAPIGEGDLPAIEAEMRRIVEEDQPFLREEVTREDAIARLEDQPFKREIVESIGSAEGEVAGGEVVSLYRNDGWVDLCEGPHVPSTGRLGAFRLTSTAGAYWRGVETNPMLTRIYGTAWATQEDLDAHLLRLGGGREARPSPARPRARPVLEPGRARSGSVDLASARRDLPQGARGLGPRTSTSTVATTWS